MNLTPTNRQTLELLISQEKERVKAGISGDCDPGTLLEDSVLGWFQDTEPMTFEEWGERLNQLEKEALEGVET